MKTRWVTATCITLLFAFAGSVVLPQDRTPDRNNHKLSQNRKRQKHIKLDAHESQVMLDWYDQQHDEVFVGRRDPNGTAPYVDSRLKIGSAHDADLRTQRPIPIGFWHRLTTFSRSYQYVAIRGHVAAIDDNYQDVNDLIHLKVYFSK